MHGAQRINRSAAEIFLRLHLSPVNDVSSMGPRLTNHSAIRKGLQQYGKTAMASNDVAARTHGSQRRHRQRVG